MLALLPAAASSAQMRVVTYNCARLNGNTSSFQAVLVELMVDDKPGFATAPWVFVIQEVPSSISNTLLNYINSSAPLGVTYAKATYTSSTLEDNSAGAIALYYRTDVLVENPAAHIDIPTGGNRNTDRWHLKLKNYTNPEVSFYVYGSHLKAESDPPDIAERNAAATAIRNNANTLPADSKILYVGDLNIYTNTEPAYLTFTANGNGRAIDALGGGSWAGSGNAIKHTQSPCLTGCDLVGGGLDDRFDFIFFTSALNNRTGLGRILGTYRTFGNDGQHYNTNINTGNNFYYPGELARSNALADALYDASDHLPVVLDFRVPAIAFASMPATIGPVIEGAVVSTAVNVINFADAEVAEGADPLNYILAGSGGLSGGTSGSVDPLPDVDVVNLPVDTSTPGVIACTATLFSSGQDVQNPTLVLNANATVYAHAAASFSSDMLVDDVVVMQSHDANTGAQLIHVDVHNLGFDALQALLDVDAVSAATPPFAFVGGIASDIADTPATLSFSFDTTGLSPGLYAEDFTIDVSDEDLPGEQFSTLSLSLHVTINEEKVVPCNADIVDNVTFQPPPDGTVDGADLAYLLGQWGVNPGSLADLVDNVTFMPPPDGVVDGADLAVLLGAWGRCE